MIGHLRCFLVVAEELHVGRAAARLGMTQPPLTQRMQRLERELGVELLDRSHRRIALTPAGAALVERARAVVAEVDGLRAHVLAGGREQRPLRLLLPRGLGPTALAGALTELYTGASDETHAGSSGGTAGAGNTVEVTCADPARRFAALAARDTDVALLPGSDPDGDTTFTQELGLAGGNRPAHPLDLDPARLRLLTEDAEHLGPEGAPEQLARRGLARGVGVCDAEAGAAGALNGGFRLLCPRELAQAHGLTWHPVVGEPVWRRLHPSWSATARQGADGPAVHRILIALFGEPGPVVPRGGKAWGLFS